METSSDCPSAGAIVRAVATSGRRLTMATANRSPKNRAVRAAVHRHDHLSKQGLLERAFTFAFRGLVYAQIWEDPAVDMEALAITPDSHVVTIASGGCNVLSYLTANPRGDHRGRPQHRAHRAQPPETVRRTAFAQLRGLPPFLRARQQPRQHRRLSQPCPPASRRDDAPLLGRPRHDRPAADRRLRQGRVQARPARQLHRRGASARAAERGEPEDPAQGQFDRGAARDLRPRIRALLRQGVRPLDHRPARVAVRPGHSARAI